MTGKITIDGSMKGRLIMKDTIKQETVRTTFDNCQLQHLYESTVDITAPDKLTMFLLRLTTYFQRRTANWIGVPTSYRQKTTKVSTASIGVTGSTTLREGDLVQVLPLEEIRKTLDKDGNCDRMKFLGGMERFCGKEFRVLKEIKFMFDEKSWRIVRLKNAVLLQDQICDSKGQYDKEGCDRSCFYFWKEQWLRKVIR